MEINISTLQLQISRKSGLQNETTITNLTRSKTKNSPNKKNAPEYKYYNVFVRP